MRVVVNDGYIPRPRRLELEMARLKPRAGIFLDVPFRDYARWPYVNNSSLGPALRCGLDYKDTIDNPADDSTATESAKAERRFHNLMHALILEPETVIDTFVLEPDFESQMLYGPYKQPKSTNEYQAIRAKFYNAHRHLEIVGDDHWVRAHTAAMNVKRKVSWMFCDEATTEVSVVSVEPETGLRTKSRIDIWRPGKFIADFKFTAFLDEFELEIRKWDYHRQAAFYQDSMFERTGKRLPYWIVAYDAKEPHYHVRAAQLSDHAIEVGRRRYMRAMRVVARGEETGKWRGYPTTLRWRLPGDRTKDVIHRGKHIQL